MGCQQHLERDHDGMLGLARLRDLGRDVLGALASILNGREGIRALDDDVGMMGWHYTMCAGMMCVVMRTSGDSRGIARERERVSAYVCTRARARV